MSTRAEQVEACKLVSEGDAFIHWDNDVRGNVASAATTLTRDGELRERLKKLVEEWPNRPLSSAASRHCGCGSNNECEAHAHAAKLADELSALMEETSDGV